MGEWSAIRGSDAVKKVSVVLLALSCSIVLMVPSVKPAWSDDSSSPDSAQVSELAKMQAE
jgi:hypothetical protein